jgi:hypothetical protein
MAEGHAFAVAPWQREYYRADSGGELTAAIIRRIVHHESRDI